LPLVQKQKGGAGGVAQIWLVFSGKVGGLTNYRPALP